MKKNVTLKIGASALALIVGASGVWADYTAFPAAGTANYSTNDNAADGEGIENVVTVTGSFNGTTVTDNAFANVDVVTASADIEVKKDAKIDGAAIPATGAEVNDVITYTYTVENIGNVTLADVKLEDSHISASGTQAVKITGCSTLDSTTTVGPDAINGDTISPFGPGDVVTCTFEYTVTQADVDQLQVTP